MSLKKHAEQTILLSIVIGTLAGCDNSINMSNENTTPGAAQTHQNIIDADSIPGFGTTKENALRDDTIALWEAYKREIIVKNCMEMSQHQYQIEVAFPTGVAIEVANSLSLPDAHTLARPTVSWGILANINANNYQRALSLGDAQKDSYFLSLYGEIAADVEFVESTGVLPPGRQDFARGGCVRQSWNEIPGVYALKRALSLELDTARQDEISHLDSSELLEKNCTGYSKTTSLAELDVFLQSNESNAITSECESEIVQRTIALNQSALQRVLTNNTNIARLHVDAYADAMHSVTNDKRFLAFLATSTHDLAVEQTLDTTLEQDE